MPVFSDVQNSTTNGSAIQNSRLSFPVGTSNPGSPSVGDAYFNTTDKKLKVYNGSTWLAFENTA